MNLTAKSDDDHIQRYTINGCQSSPSADVWLRMQHDI